MAREMSDFSCSKIEPLTGENYHIWEMKVSAVLRSRKLFKAVIEADEPPDLGEAGSDIENKARDAWEAKNNEAFTIIIVTLSPEQAGLFVGTTNAKTVWNELKEIHTGNVEDLRIDVTLELKNIKMKVNETVDSYITRARNISTRCASLGQIISEREIVYHVVRGVNEKYEAVASVLRPQRSAKLEEVRQSLKEEEIRINQRNGGSMKSNEAYKAAVSKGFRKPGHWEKKCFVCGKAGHLAKMCWHRNAKKESQNNYSKPNESRYQGNQHRDKNGGKKMENAGSASTKQKEERAFMANSYPHLSTNEQECDIEIWNLDSGSTSHMTPRRDWLENVQPETSQINLAGNNKCIQAKAKGDLSLAILEEGEERQIRIKDVLYVPELRTNLLSVKSIVSKGNQVVFDQTGAKIYDSESQILAVAHEEDNLYVLETKTFSGNTAVNCLLSKENR